MIVHTLETEKSIAGQFLSELRNIHQQSDRHRFRFNLSRLGEVMAYEISKELPYHLKDVETPLGMKSINLPVTKVVLVTILRAGLPFLEGFQRVYDQAETGFIGSYRVEGEGDIHISTDYLASPSLEGNTVILIDTMLATGRSIIDAIDTLMRRGRPAHLHIASVIAAPEGVKHLLENVKLPATLWTFSVDERLNSKFYIVPGLGDAGDLSFGPK
jgi:uracil phosphoribosyltransferase